MQDSAWVHKMDICGQTDRVWDVLRSARNADDTDEVMEAVCLLFLDILVGSGEGVSSVLQADAGSVVELLARNIGMRTGPLDAGYASKVTPVVSLPREPSDARYPTSAPSIARSRATRTSLPRAARPPASSLMSARRPGGQ